MNQIDKLDIDFQLNDGQPLFPDRQLLKDWVYKTLLPIIEQLLDAQNTDLEIDTLTIDLGAFSRDEFTSLIPKALRDKLSELLAEHLSNTEIQPDLSITGFPEHSDLWRILVQALAGQSGNKLNHHWDELIQNYEHPTYTYILACIKQQPVRHHIAREFPLWLQNRIITLLEPSNSTFIQQLLSYGTVLKPETIQSDKEYISSDLYESQKTRPYLVEYTLSYLAVERGSQFNKKSYLHSLIRQQAAHHNLSFADLVKDIRVAISETTMPSVLRDQLLTFLPDDLTKQDKKVVDSGSQEIATDYHWLEIFDQKGLWSFALSWNQWFSRLQQYPDLLNRFFCELKKSDLRLKHLMGHLNDTDKYNLLKALMVLNQRSTALPGTLTFNTLLDTVQQRANNTEADLIPSFYYQIIKAVLASEVIDLDAFQANKIVFPENQAIVHKSTDLPENIASLDDKAIEHSRFTDQSTPSDGNSPFLKQLYVFTETLSWSFSQTEWQSLIRNQTSALQCFLKGLPVNTIKVKQLIDALPEKVQRDWITLLAKQNKGFFQTLSSHSHFNQWLQSPVRKKHGSSLNVRDWEQAVTRFTLEYLLLKSESEFNRTRYLQKLIRQLSARYNLRYQDFMKALQESFLQKHLPESIRQEFTQIFQSLDLQLSTSKRCRKEIDKQFDGKVSKALLSKLIDKPNISDQLLEQSIQTINPVLYTQSLETAKILQKLFFQGTVMGISDATIRETYWHLWVSYLDRTSAAFSPEKMIAFFIKALQDKFKITTVDMLQIWQQQLDHHRHSIPESMAPSFRQAFNNCFDLKSAATTTGSITLSDITQQTSKIPDHNSSALESAKAIETTNRNGRKLTLIQDNQQLSDLETPSPVPLLNAGLVLLSPYLPVLLERLEVLNPDKSLDTSQSHIALSALAYLVWGDAYQCQSSEPLSRLICGLSLDGTKPDNQATISDSHKSLINSLLNGIINHWSALGNTSISGLQDTFLQRQGHLIHIQDKGWQLHIESQPFDMLLDRLPWSYATIRHPFMAEPVYVHWRNTRHDHKYT